jgi:low temperature requirement protein LtrA
LLVILVLGEVVGPTVTGVHDLKWATAAVAVAVLGFIAAARCVELLRRRGRQQRRRPAATRRRPTRRAETSADDDVGERQDLFIYGHLPLTLGIAAAGVGLEDLVLDSGASLPRDRRSPVCVCTRAAAIGCGRA